MWHGGISISTSFHVEVKRDVMYRLLTFRPAVVESPVGHLRKKDAVLEAVDKWAAITEYRSTGFDTRGLVTGELLKWLDADRRTLQAGEERITIEPPHELLASVGLDMGSYYRYAAAKYDLPVELFYKDTEYENLE